MNYEGKGKSKQGKDKQKRKVGRDEGDADSQALQLFTLRILLSLFCELL